MVAGDWALDTPIYTTICYAKYLKVAGVNTLNVYAWLKTSSGGSLAYVRTTVTGATALELSNSIAGFVEKSGTIDVSGLVNGTYYTVTIAIKNANGATTTTLNSVTAISS